MGLRVAEVFKEYATRSGPLPVLCGVSLTLEAGESCAIQGPSGSGKSTLLNILGTLDRPTRGEVQLDGQNPFTLRETELAAFRNRQVGFIFQDHHLLPQCSALENVLTPTLVSRGAAPDAMRRAKALLERVGLAGRLEHRPAELSGGERQRVAVARALINRPHLVLADEPTGNLDHAAAGAVAALLLELCRQEQAMLAAVTHSGALAALFEKRFVMAEGKLQPS